MKLDKNQKIDIVKVSNFRIKKYLFNLHKIKKDSKYKRNASVIVLLSLNNQKTDLNVILTKRSSKISQPGDLCYPGGLLSSRIDSIISKGLRLPKTPLTKWSFWHCLKIKEKEEFSLFLSTAVRESFEEIKLNPLKIELIGNLPIQYSEFTSSKIYSFVCITKQKKFFLNSEVDKIIYVPISSFFVRKNYSVHKLNNIEKLINKKTYETINFPCFNHYQNGKKEIIWGLTYRITKLLLEKIFNFHLL